MAVALIFGVGLALAGFASAAEKPIVLRYAGNFPIKHFMTEMMQEWGKLVEQRTNNRVKIEIYPAGQLYTDRDLDRALSSGAVDLGQAQANVLSGIAPATGLLDFSMLWDDWDHFDRVVHKGGGLNIIDQDAKAHNMKEIFIMPYGYTLGPITTKKKITVHEDMKGLKIRAMGGQAAMALQALGGTPVFLGSGEVYQALQRGTVDGAISGLSSMYERAWGEVTKYLWMLMLCPATAGHTVANLQSWNKLPADVQKVMLDTGRELELKYRASVMDQENKECLEGLKKKGVEVIYPTEKETAICTKLVRPIQDEWAKKSKPSKDLIDLARKESKYK